MHPRVKAITRHFRAHIATVRKFFATDDEAKDVVDSLARFARARAKAERRGAFGMHHVCAAWSGRVPQHAG